MITNFIDSYYLELSQSRLSDDELAARTGLDAKQIKKFNPMRYIIMSYLKDVVDRWEVLYPDAVELNVRDITEKYIKSILGGLDDMPSKLIEVIRETVYDYFAILEDAHKPGWIAEEFFSAEAIEDGYEYFIEKRERLKRQIEEYPEAVAEIRETEDPLLRKYWTDFVIDYFKCGLDETEKRPSYLRIVEISAKE